MSIAMIQDYAEDLDDKASKRSKSSSSFDPNHLAGIPSSRSSSTTSSNESLSVRMSGRSGLKVLRRHHLRILAWQHALLRWRLPYGHTSGALGELAPTPPKERERAPWPHSPANNGMKTPVGRGISSPSRSWLPCQWTHHLLTRYPPPTPSIEKFPLLLTSKNVVRCWNDQK